jgi:hypothetical protein
VYRSVSEKKAIPYWQYKLRLRYFKIKDEPPLIAEAEEIFKKRGITKDKK